MSQVENSKNLSKKTQQKNGPISIKDIEDEGEDIEEFEHENWNNVGGNHLNQEWEVNWDNKVEVDEFYNEFKEFLLKK